jgi:hypothetical protein
MGTKVLALTFQNAVSLRPYFHEGKRKCIRRYRLQKKSQNVRNFCKKKFQNRLRNWQQNKGQISRWNVRPNVIQPLNWMVSLQLLTINQWPCGLRRGSAAARLLGLRVRIPQGAWMSVCCECCVMLGRGLCDDLITRPEESHRVWCVWVWSWSLDNEEA